MQRRIESIPDGLKDKLRVIAVSSLDGRPVFLQEEVGHGAIYALDFLSLDEPQVTWETRGSFNKHVFSGNLIGKSSFEKLPYQLALEGGRRGFLPEVFLQNYQLRGLIWEEDLYRSAVVNEMIASWTLSAFLDTP